MAFKHGNASAYTTFACRCAKCKKAYKTRLKRRAKEQRGKRDESKRLPSVTNSLLYDTMTREEFMRLRGYKTESTK